MPKPIARTPDPYTPATGSPPPPQASARIAAGQVRAGAGRCVRLTGPAAAQTGQAREAGWFEA